MAIRYLTAGESHGKGLTAILEGIPAGVPLTESDVNEDLLRRQHTFGRGERLRHIEKDAVEFLSGVRFGETLGDPITMAIKNKDWVNWEKIMSIRFEDYDEKVAVLRPRPGHADLAGVIKFNRSDIRDILERASARETAARTAVGAVCRKFLSLFDIHVYSWVLEIGGIKAKGLALRPNELHAAADASPVRCPDREAAKKMTRAIQQAKKEGDTLGGVYEIVATGLPVGLGSHVQWDLKLDGLLAQGLMSIQAHKAVEIGGGFGMARRKGSQVNDEIFYSRERGFFRKTNNAGGVEGGMTNGEPIVLRAAIKPLSSLRRPLRSVHLKTKEELKAEIVRSDVSPVASAAVIGEAVVAITLAQAMVHKFGGDSVREIKDNVDRYQAYVRET
ncbi:MAG: chorismate synthase [Elusimicrobia bacterium]|nr:chorismate synthase [Candidatus Obscuribacterium magneticum]